MLDYCNAPFINILQYKKKTIAKSLKAAPGLVCNKMGKLMT